MVLEWDFVYNLNKSCMMAAISKSTPQCYSIRERKQHMKKIRYPLLLVISYSFSMIAYYFFSYCYQLHTFRGEWDANIKNLNSDNYLLYLSCFIAFSLITTVILYRMFKHLQRSVLNVLLHICIVLLLNYSICIIIPIYSFFFDDWMQLAFSIWNRPFFIINLISSIVITLLLYLSDFYTKKAELFSKDKF